MVGELALDERSLCQALRVNRNNIAFFELEGSPWLRGHRSLIENLDLRSWVKSLAHAAIF